MMHAQEEAAVGPELPSKRQQLRNQIKLTEIVRNGIDPALKILQLDGLYPPRPDYVCYGQLTDLEKMFQKKRSHVKELEDRLQQDRQSLEKLQQTWGAGGQSDVNGRLSCDLTWLYDEDQQSQIKRLQDSIRQKAERLVDYLIAWKNDYVNALILSMADN